MNDAQHDVIVIGAGISGLSVAHWLTKHNVNVIVLEQDAQVGGTMKSVSEQGFLSETGPNSALETTPLFQELVADCGLQDEFIYANPVGKNRYILRGGKLYALPLTPPAFIRTRLFSTSGKLRLLKEPFVGRGVKEESVAEFVTRRVGREFLDYAIDPFVAGVFAGRPEMLSVRSAFPKLYALEEKYGGLVKGMIKGRQERKKRSEKAKDRAETFSFRSGMQAFPNAIAQKLGRRVVTGVVVNKITRKDSQSPFIVEYSLAGETRRLESRQVILAIPAYAASRYIEHFSSSVAALLHSINYSPAVSLFFGFKSEDIRQPLDGFGFLIPTKEQRKILGCLWSSSLFPHRAPEGMVGLTAFVGGARQPKLTELSENELCDLVLTELKKIMQIEGKHVYLRSTRWEKAIPQYELGYHRITEALDQFEQEQRGLTFCSNFKGGISVGDCVKNSYEVAQRIEASLHSSSAVS